MIKHTTFVGNNDPTHLKSSPTKYTRNDDITLPGSSESAMLPNVQTIYGTLVNCAAWQTLANSQQNYPHYVLMIFRLPHKTFHTTHIQLG